MDKCRLEARKQITHSKNKNTINKYLLQVSDIWENHENNSDANNRERKGKGKCGDGEELEGKNTEQVRDEQNIFTSSTKHIRFHLFSCSHPFLFLLITSRGFVIIHNSQSKMLFSFVGKCVIHPIMITHQMVSGHTFKLLLIQFCSLYTE